MFLQKLKQIFAKMTCYNVNEYILTKVFCMFNSGPTERKVFLKKFSSYSEPLYLKLDSLFCISFDTATMLLARPPLTGGLNPAKIFEDLI